MGSFIFYNGRNMPIHITFSSAVLFFVKKLGEADKLM